MDRHSLAGSLLTLCALTNVHLAAQQFPTGTFSAEFNDGSTGTVEISGPDAGGNYTVKLPVDGISLSGPMRLKDGHLVGTSPLLLIQHSSTNGDCVVLGLLTSGYVTGSAQKGC
jgi:hypothetical protein